MAKPICIVRVNMNIFFKDGRDNLNKLSNSLINRLIDYHVFVLPQADNPKKPKEDVEFQVFYEKDFTEIKYKELKEIIENSLK